MRAIELRNKIIQSLNTEDISFLENIFKFVQKQKETVSENDIVVYTIQGQPVSRKQYIESNNEAMASYKKGDFKTQKEILQKFATK